MFTRPLVSEDCIRLRVYAPLVKNIAEPYIISTKDLLSPSVWTFFREHGIGSLFNLSFLHYVSLSPSEEPQQWADPIHNFIGPSLLIFRLILQGGKDYEDLVQDPDGLLEAKPDPVLLDILAHLSSHCPRIRHFEFDTTPFPFYAADSLSAAVCRWSYLRSFEAHTCPLRPEALRHLAALPSLRLLDASIDLPPADLVHILLPHSEAPRVFPALHELALHAPHLRICTRMLELIESMILAKISIYAYAHASPEDIEGVFSALATCGSRDTITNLLVEPGCTTHSPPPPSLPPSSESLHDPTGTPAVSVSGAPPQSHRPHAPLPQTTFAPLLSLGSLRKLSLLGPCFSSLHEATLTAMAHAFPHLDTALLCPAANANASADGGGGCARVALAGLDALARFTDLRTAQLSLADVDEHALADAFARQHSVRVGPPLRLVRASSSSSFPSSPSPSPSPSQAGTGSSIPPTPAADGSTAAAELALELPNVNTDLGPESDDGVQVQVQSSSSTSLLWCLAVGHARIAESCVEGTAAALSAWFPRLAATNFTFYPGSDERVLHAMGFRDDDDVMEVRERWWRVGELVRSFASVREQERRWAADRHTAPT